MKVLAVGAHPDDLELFCGGTLARYAKSGHHVTMCHLTRGDKGDVIIPGDEIAAIRGKEAENSAALIGADAIDLKVDDTKIFIEQKLRDLLVDVIRKVNPDIIITHSPEDYVADHVNTGRLVEEASFWAALSPYTTGTNLRSACEKIPPLYYMDTVAGVNFTPEEYVDISATFSQKKEMISCHKSQLSHMKGCFGMDMLYHMEIAARFRGIQSGVEFAEGFRKLQTWPRLRTERMLP